MRERDFGSAAVQGAAFETAAGDDHIVRRVESAVPAFAVALHDEIAEALAGVPFAPRTALDLGADDARLAELQQRVAAGADDQLGRPLGPEFVAEEIVQMA